MRAITPGRLRLHQRPGSTITLELDDVQSSSARSDDLTVATVLHAWGHRFAFIIWMGATSVIVTTFMVGHWYTLPAPEDGDPVTRAALGRLRGDGDRGWMAVHVLYTKCACSGRVVDHLLSSVRPSTVAEKILLVGPPSEIQDQLGNRGFDVHSVTQRNLKESYHIEAAPLLAVVAPDGAVAYVGGYTERKQGPALKDIDIIATAMAARKAPTLPLFGCGVSQRLQALLDPWGLKYSKDRESKQ